MHKLVTRLVAVWVFWMLAFTGSLGCAGHQKLTLEQGMGAAIGAADIAYSMSVEVCDLREQAIVARKGSTAEQDKADLAKVRNACDTVFNTFEKVRENQQLLKAAVKVLEAP